MLNNKITKSKILPKPARRTKMNGILSEKKGEKEKNNILKNLGGLFGKNWLQFRENLQFRKVSD